MAAFGLISLFLASAGIYGVMAHYVSQRRHEIGVRMALGASARQVLSLTLRQGLRMAALGIAIGLTLGALLARGMQNVLFGVIGFEPSLFVLGPIVLGMVAALATLLPARAASRVDPVSALRD
jgi:ABC-type antimicrobial peptide transport system permease subunit